MFASITVSGNIFMFPPLAEYGKMFMADSNYQAAAYFDFKDVELDAAKFDEIWKLFGDDETLPEIT